MDEKFKAAWNENINAYLNWISTQVKKIGASSSFYKDFLCFAFRLMQQRLLLVTQSKRFECPLQNVCHKIITPLPTKPFKTYNDNNKTE